MEKQSINPRATLLVVECAFAAAVLGYALVGWRLEAVRGKGGEPLVFTFSEYLKLFLLATAIIIFPLLSRLRKDLHRREAASRETAAETPAWSPRLVRGYLLLFALAELPAILGLILFLLGHPLHTLLLTCGLSLFYIAAMTPPAEPRSTLF